MLKNTAVAVSVTVTVEYLFGMLNDVMGGRGVET